jgi:hypothetical protein
MLSHSVAPSEATQLLDRLLTRRLAVMSWSDPRRSHLARTARLLLHHLVISHSHANLNTNSCIHASTACIGRHAVDSLHAL